ncbi:MAG: tRNA (adenosine(37)-N6)-threonylcarbamoyltransferase complex transferase subunit TsaD [Verrucomicrobiota bacterium]|nr:tRNA (adenosine(37)-N6)-threonylcarbamoyltransferase complex transferase subunit TsaD [Verrucomicrobiota bacterium]
MLLIAIETSCDETSVAVLKDGCVLANAVSSQAKLHEEYGGVVPELASREHLRNLMPVARQALGQAGVTPDQIDVVAGTRGPGLPGALLVGLRASQGIAFVLDKPFIGIHHHEAHLYSPWISGDPLSLELDAFEPNVSLIVSGGHTMLVQVSVPMKHRVLGMTVDDAAGECFDKVAKLIGLPYPGGPQLDRLAKEGNDKIHQFPRPKLHDESHDFSFSGLKTSVRYFIRDNPEVLEDGARLRDLCAGVQSAIVDVLVKKTVRAAKQLGVRCITASGGVTCNSGLRIALEQACRHEGFTLRLTNPKLCTDNAAMVGMVAHMRLANDCEVTSLDAEIMPNWPLAQLA